MDTEIVGDINKLAEIALTESHEALREMLGEIDYNISEGGINIVGTFSYLNFRDGRPIQEEFVNLIYHKIVPYCLSRKFIAKCRENLQETKEARWLHEPVDAAKELFIKAKKKNPKSGEVGEVVLFTLLEGLIGAPKIVSKMKLKTNSNMEIYGSDGIHIKFDKNTEELLIYWGEAKLWKELSSAITDIMESIKEFHKPDEITGEKQRDFDINIIREYADIDTTDNEKAKELLLNYLDPYRREYRDQMREIHACLAIWDWKVYETIIKKSSTPEEIEAKFIKRYRSRIEKASKLFVEKARESGIDRLRFHFFLLPLHNIEEFRKRFCQKVGLPYQKLQEPAK